MISNYKKVLVTGGAGCIGMPLCKKLVEQGCEVVIFDLFEQIILVDKLIKCLIS